ncbi:unnamed protein product [Cyprideis torosa]|uniref:Uncharacterized protein n=1 Tax=Cyprideis torosa TaxID=163714 RepID=A0A7R8WD69_9CRUS|nr:unnamed protein product [Cyprideis torosa]CAG0889088.1 unnamed protein product [Cyprideis torosa]
MLPVLHFTSVIPPGLGHLPLHCPYGLLLPPPWRPQGLSPSAHLPPQTPAQDRLRDLARHRHVLGHVHLMLRNDMVSTSHRMVFINGPIRNGPFSASSWHDLRQTCPPWSVDSWPPQILNSSKGTRTYQEDQGCDAAYEEWKKSASKRKRESGNGKRKTRNGGPRTCGIIQAKDRAKSIYSQWLSPPLQESGVGFLQWFQSCLPIHYL